MIRSSDGLVQPDDHPSDEPLPKVQPVRLLIVEDDLLQQGLFAALLPPPHFHCTIVATIAEAQDVADPDRFDGALIDLRLRDGSGLDLAADLQAQGLASAMVTADTSSTFHSAARKLGTPVITKPLKAASFVGEVASFLDRA